MLEPPGTPPGCEQRRAYFVHHCANRIAVSIDSNEAKHRLLNAGMVLGMVGVGIFLIAIIGFFAL